MTGLQSRIVPCCEANSLSLSCFHSKVCKIAVTKLDTRHYCALRGQSRSNFEHFGNWPWLSMTWSCCTASAFFCSAPTPCTPCLPIVVPAGEYHTHCLSGGCLHIAPVTSSRALVGCASHWFQRITVLPAHPQAAIKSPSQASFSCKL